MESKKDFCQHAAPRQKFPLFWLGAVLCTLGLLAGIAAAVVASPWRYTLLALACFFVVTGLSAYARFSTPEDENHHVR